MKRIKEQVGSRIDVVQMKYVNPKPADVNTSILFLFERKMTLFIL